MAAQFPTTAPAVLRLYGHHLLALLRGQERPLVFLVSRLPAPFPFGFRFRRRWLGVRVLTARRQRRIAGRLPRRTQFRLELCHFKEFCTERAALSRLVIRFSLLFSNPAKQRARRHDRCQLMKRLAELLGEPDQAMTFLRGDRDSRGQFAAEDLVFDLQVLDLAGQFLLGRSGDDQQQGLIDVLHRGKMLKSL
jgi:hypothetical protein